MNRDFIDIALIVFLGVALFFGGIVAGLDAGRMSAILWALDNPAEMERLRALDLSDEALITETRAAMGGE